MMCLRIQTRLSVQADLDVGSTKRVVCDGTYARQASIHGNGNAAAATNSVVTATPRSAEVNGPCRNDIDDMELLDRTAKRCRRASILGWAAILIVVLALHGCASDGSVIVDDDPGSHNGQFSPGETVAVVITRGLEEFGTKHGIDLIYVDPSSPRFGTFLQRFTALPYEGGQPPHHLYYSPWGRLYATGLDPRCSLMEVELLLDNGTPVIESVECLPTGGQVVGENILWRTVNGREFMYVTFMGGNGTNNMVGQGSVVVYNATTHDIVTVIEDPDDPDDPDDPFLKYSHGISAYDNVMVIASTVIPSIDLSDPINNVGNSISLINMETNQLTTTYVIDDGSPDELPSSPIEVLFLRPEIHPDLNPGVLVNTMFGGDVWYAPYKPEQKRLGEFRKIYDGAEEHTGVPLEFYTYEDKLYISHAVPGVIKQYDLIALPNLVPVGPDFIAEAGAHHLVFFEAGSGKKVMASQNNLLDLRDSLGVPLSAHSLTVHDLESGTKLRSIDFFQKYKLGLENIVGGLDKYGNIGEEWFSHHH